MNTELALPLVRQATPYWCGPASLLSALRYLGVAGRASQRSLAVEMSTRDYFCQHCRTDGGTTTDAMVASASKRWATVDVRSGLGIDDLRHIVNLGDVAILLVQAWSTTLDARGYTDKVGDGHYVIATSVRRDDVLLMDPSSPCRAKVSHQSLLDRWHEEGAQYIERGSAIVLKGPAEPRRRRVGRVVEMG